jgi:signal transduction histidine kinase
VVAVPVPHDEQVIGVVRASSDTGAAVWRRVITAWLALLGIALLALGAAVFTARRQARALSEPLEDLSRTCRAVTDGHFTARAAPSAVAEIDQVARTHNEMVQRLAQLLQNERDFTANASHRLRTPIAGLQLGLESALSTPGADLRTAMEEALERTRHLHGTVEEVLQLARTQQPAPASAALEPLGRLLDDLENRWHGLLARDGRRLDFPVAPELRSVPVPGRPLAQILDILLDNARGHGHGSVEVSARDLADAVALDVRDEGAIRTDPAALFARGHTTGTGAGGIGLALAREIAEAAGGRLVLANPGPTTFPLLIPLGGSA